MFDYGDEVQLTEESCKYYDSDEQIALGLCGVPLTVVGIDDSRADGVLVYDVEDGDGECFTFFGYELEYA